MSLYPVNMNSHGPNRSLEDYLAELWERYDRMPNPSDKLLARIRAIEAEIEARGKT